MISTKEQEEQDMTEERINGFEELSKKLLEFEFITTSPNDGSLISTIRSEDVLNTIAEFYNIDISKTNYSEFKK